MRGKVKKVETTLQNTSIREVPHKGLAVYAKRKFLKGETVVVGIPLMAFPERSVPFSYQVHEDKHVILAGTANIVNHCCDANTGAKLNQHDGYDFVARREIEPEEEITIDYETTEWEVVGFKECYCGSERCRKVILGFRFRSEELRQHYGDEFIADYLKERLKAEGT